MKYLKTFEHFDTPELRDTTSGEEFKKLTNVNLKPFKNKFRYGSYDGKGGELNFSMDKAKWGRTELYGITEYLYKKIIRDIPEFKNFRCNKDYENDKIFALHFIKEANLNSKKGYKASVEMWVSYRAKLESGDYLIGYKKNKIKILFVTHIEKIHSNTNLFSLMKEPEDISDPGKELDNPVSKLNMKHNPLSSEYVEPTPEEQKLEDELWDKAIDNMYKNMRGDIDEEDLSYYKKLEISYTNLTLDSVLKQLPKVKKNYEIFQNYIKNKYDTII